MPHTSSQAFLRELDKKLWTAADKLRSNLDAAVYKHAVLGLIFLKYVSDSFAQRQAELEAMLKDPENDFFVDPAGYDKPAQYDEAIHRELEERVHATCPGIVKRRRTPKSIVSLIVEMIEPSAPTVCQGRRVRSSPERWTSSFSSSMSATHAACG